MNFKMKCPECSHEFLGESTSEYVKCPSCQKEISVNKAIKYFQFFDKIKIDKKIIAEGELYAKVDTLIEKSKWYTQNGEYEEALKATDEALKLSTVDGRIYLARVYARTKNFTDYDDITHYADLKKALDLPPVFEKERIRKLYAPYYKKANVPKDELNEYENQEATSRLKRVESLLKDSIPSHYKRQKAFKPSVIAIILLTVIATALMILSFALDVSLLSLISASVLIIVAFILIKYVDDVKKVMAFDAVLDFYDAFESFELSPRYRLKTSIELEKLAVSQINGESTMKTDGLIRELLAVILESNTQNAIAFIVNKPTFNKYLKNEQD